MKYAVLAVVAAELLAYVIYPRALAALGWLPLFGARVLTPDPSWSAVLRTIDSKGAAYRAPARMDLAPLAGALGPRALSTTGAEAHLSADGRLAVVRVRRFMPFLSIIPFCLVARMSLADRDASIAIRVYGYPLFSASAAFAAFATIWLGPSADTASVVAICASIWLGLEVLQTRPRVFDVLAKLEDRLANPRG